MKKAVTLVLLCIAVLSAVLCACNSNNVNSVSGPLESSALAFESSPGPDDVQSENESVETQEINHSRIDPDIFTEESIPEEAGEPEESIPEEVSKPEESYDAIIDTVAPEFWEFNMFLCINNDKDVERTILNFYDENNDKDYALLPLTIILKSSGAKITWRDSNTADIKINGKNYVLDCEKRIFRKADDAKNIFKKLDLKTMYFKTDKRELHVDNYTVDALYAYLKLPIRIVLSDISWGVYIRTGNVAEDWMTEREMTIVLNGKTLEQKQKVIIDEFDSWHIRLPFTEIMKTYGAEFTWSDPYNAQFRLEIDWENTAYRNVYKDIKTRLFSNDPLYGGEELYDFVLNSKKHSIFLAADAEEFEFLIPLPGGRLYTEATEYEFWVDGLHLRYFIKGFSLPFSFIMDKENLIAYIDTNGNNA